MDTHEDPKGPQHPEVTLVRRNGRLVATTSQSMPQITNDDVINFIHKLREERMEHLVFHVGNPNAECHCYD